uniref:ATPase n=1 Tax=Chlorobium chlorochromatii (strain CaD3) TaxID=340177 RepID=Q3ASN8_CHLCH
MNIDRRLFQLMKDEPKPFLFSLGNGALATVLLLAQAYFLSTLLALAFLPSASLHVLWQPMAMFALTSSLRLAMNWFSRQEAERGTLAIRSQLFRRLTAAIGSLGPLYVRSVQSGRLSNTLLKGVEALEAYFSHYIPQIFFALFTPLLIALTIMVGDPLSGGILLLSAPLIPIFMMVIGKSAKAMTDKQWSAMSRMSGYFLDVLQGLPTLKLFAQSHRQHEAIEQTGENFRHATMRVLKVAFLSSLTLELVGTIGTAIIAISIGMRLMAGECNIQHALFVLLLVPDFYLPLRQLGTKFHTGMEGATASKEIFAILDRNAEATPSATSASQAEMLQQLAMGDICLENISYRYPESDKMALQSITLTIPVGKTTALIGPSGSGKSTLLNLLLRFQTPSEGSIKLGSSSIHALPLDLWHQHIAWVPQHPFLFNTTLRDNIMMARPSASLQELEQVLQQSGLRNVVESLPQGLDTMLGEEGARLSGGEAQRIALARAFLKNAPIVLLDEPTSHTDPQLEAALRHSMQQLMEGRTTVLIAHRLETIQTAHQIVVLSNGVLAACGTHEELLQSNSFYQTSLNAQAEVAA